MGPAAGRSLPMPSCTPHHRALRAGTYALRRCGPAAIAAGVGVFASTALRAQLPWLHALYLPAVILAVGVSVRLVRWRRGRPSLRWPALAVTALSLASLVPVPWLVSDAERPPGTAWQLDGLLVIDGETVDPPGAWYWLTAGRPPIAGEVVLAHLGAGRPPRSLRDGNARSRPRSSEPLAVAVGLTRAAPGRVAATPPANAYLGGPLARTLPGRWFRNLSVGRSHGLIVALAAYAWSSGHDLARGRAIAGTGAVQPDGSVAPIASLAAKATAARDAGVQVLVYPAVQEHDLAKFDPGTMQLMPVASVSEAIRLLASSSS